MKNFQLILSVCLMIILVSSTIFSQAVGDFGSKATGNWGTDATNWVTYTITGWDGTAGGAPTTADNVWIRAGHTVTAEAVGKVCNNLTVEGNATLVTSAASGANNITLSGTSLTLQANSTYKLGGTSSAFGTVWTNVSVDNASTVEFNGTQSALPMTSGTITFGNLNWYASNTVSLAQSANVLQLVVNGNLAIGSSSTSTSKIRGATTNYAGTITHTVYGNLTINTAFSSSHQGLSLVNAAPSPANVTFDVKGDVYVKSGKISMEEASGSTTPTSKLTVGGNLIVGDGGATAAILQFGTNAANVGTAIVDLKGNVTVASNGSIAKNAGGGGTFSFNLIGISVQNWTGAFPLAFTSTVCNLVVNNANGITIGNDVTVNSGVTLTLTNGKVTLGSNNIIISGSLSGASASNYVVATGSGELRKTFTADGSFTYPVGDASNYSPVTLTLNGAGYSSAYVGVKLNNIKHALNTSSTDYLNRYWTVTASGVTGGSYNADFVYVDGDVAGTETNLALGQYNGIQWIVVGSNNAGTNTLSATGLTSFSDFTGGEAGALPVQLASFVGNVVGNNAQLEWQTISEINNYGFNVQRYDAISKSYNNVGFVAGKGIPCTYTYEDKNVSGSLEYRLEQIDNNGLTSYFGPIMLNPNSVGSDAVPAVFALNQNYPNPFNPSTIINYQLAIDNYTTLKVYNLIGKEVATLVNGNQSAGSHQVTFDGSALTSGVYFYKLQSGSSVEVKKLTLVK
jgi:hypothetical protein